MDRESMMVGLKDMFGGGGEAGSFLGLPGTDIAAPEGDVILFGADCATPYASVGAYCAGGADAIRAGSEAYAGDVSKVNFDLGGPVLPHGISARDAGNLSLSPSEQAKNRLAIEAATRAIIAAGGVPVLLGGDDSVPIPMLTALDNAPLTILQIDAHIDWRNEVEGETLGLSSTMRRASEMAHVERIVQVGARGIGSARMTELNAARDWGAHLVPARDLSRNGVGPVVDLIPEGARVAICFDCDALDPSIMPAVIAPTAGGLGYDAVLDLVEAVVKRAHVVAVDMVEFMPAADRDGIGARTAAQLLTSIIGLIARKRAETR
ncbi:arginase family protein [Lutimaribacter marinistellae]|uniref:Arginase family protein n=1 Tax=Lutimaribacter marinistellae TaxID=1820329 RepID=A0ABV7TGV9_9RHOB